MRRCFATSVQGLHELAVGKGHHHVTMGGEGVCVCGGGG